MIQRFQTILLFLAAAANFAVLWLPYGFSEDNKDVESPRAYMNAASIEYGILITSDNEEKYKDKGARFGQYLNDSVGPGDNVLLLFHVILVVTTGFFLVLLIFLYGNRPRQAQLCYAAIGALMLQITISAAIFYSVLPELIGANAEGVNPERFTTSPQYGMFVPIIAVLLTWWASKRILRDERLVRESSRLR